MTRSDNTGLIGAPKVRDAASVKAALSAAARKRILVLDGAMGTMLQREGLTEADFRGEVFAAHTRDLKGNNDALNLTRPDVVQKIHEAFLEAGADIIETNTFNGTTISQADYALEGYMADINEAGARIARKAADLWTAKDTSKSRFVAGAVGPTNKTLSVSPDVNNPGHRDVSFKEMVAAYQGQIEALMRGGVDIILIETIFDTLNAKAAIFAAEEAFDALGARLPVMLSCTITDMSGRNLSGQTAEAFWYSVRHAQPFSVGLNCAFGAEHLRPSAVILSAISDTLTCFYPNAGLPNELGEYDETPEVTASHLQDWAKNGLVNIVGGCCGTTPDHIRAIAAQVAGLAPRTVPAHKPEMALAGLEAAVFRGVEADDFEAGEVEDGDVEASSAADGEDQL